MYACMHIHMHAGGQKHRIALARVCYAEADVVLLDDPLSAVDAHVGRHLMQHAICGALASATRVLVTHQLQFLPEADLVIKLEKGRITASGTYAELLAQGVSFAEVQMDSAGEDEGSDVVVKEGDTGSLGLTAGMLKAPGRLCIVLFCFHFPASFAFFCCFSVPFLLLFCYSEVQRQQCLSRAASLCTGMLTDYESLATAAGTTTLLNGASSSGSSTKENEESRDPNAGKGTENGAQHEHGNDTLTSKPESLSLEAIKGSNSGGKKPGSQGGKMNGRQLVCLV
jgi:hypothetical protein